MNIFVSGSIAYDRIMKFPGKFSDYILPEKIDMLNVCFSITDFTEKFGGTAGNIAYGLSLLGKKPTVLATAGHDFEKYRIWLERNTISGDTIKIIEDAFTAGAYITTDENNNQITCFNPGAMLYTSDFNFDSLHANDSIGIIAPGNLEDMLIYSRIYKEKRIDYIFDPGQSIPSWEKEQLMEMMSGSKVFISNEYELELIIGKIGLDNREILEKTEAVITTKGEHGSTIITHDRTIHIMAVKPRRVIDPTGAGDAYRAGLIKGLSEHNDLVYSAQLGAVSASFSVEEAGTQAYHFTMDEFTERFRETFS